jgi:NAD(P)-dependent dehydrogenase (short-subunit alcohol dehydrogenase family)
MAFLERLLPAMASRGWGRVVAVGSMAVREPIDNLQLSNAHRPGLVAAFKVLARRYAADGVTLNFVHPGRIATDRVVSTAGSLEAAEENARRSVPAGPARGGRRGGGLPLLRAGVLHHRHEPAGGRLRHPRHLVPPAGIEPAISAVKGRRPNR